MIPGPGRTLPGGTLPPGLEYRDEDHQYEQGERQPNQKFISLKYR